MKDDILFNVFFFLIGGEWTERDERLICFSDFINGIVLIDDCVVDPFAASNHFYVYSSIQP